MTARLVKKRLTPTGKIREAVFERANGFCEACHCAEPEEFDHFFGRVRVPESVETGWAVCRQCHLRKTRNEPTAFYWSKRFLIHAVEYSYWKEADMALARILTLKARETFEEQR